MLVKKLCPLILLTAIVAAALGGSRLMSATLAEDHRPSQNTAATTEPGHTFPVVYKNSQYGFSFSLPESWTGYEIVVGSWEGYTLTDSPGVRSAWTGPMLSIRHPKWTAQDRRQDIPIMIFTLEEWNALQQEKFHIGAAPMNPSELARGDNHVFALPARYNYAFPEGFEEVEYILRQHPLRIDR